METMISMYIDNELDLEEKIRFVEIVHRDKGFKGECIELLEQEKLLRADVVARVPLMNLGVRRRRMRPILQPLGWAMTALALGLAIFFLFDTLPRKTPSMPHRFVIYRPEVSQVEIAGTFTEWKRLSMNRIGSSGYWEITLDLPKGEHRFTYILESNQRLADPTILARERDDFGGENSILRVEAQV